MTLNTSVADDQLGQYYRRTAAIADRLDKSLPFDMVMTALQRIHDGLFDGAQVTKKQVVIESREWKVWKTIKLGMGLKTAADFRKAFTDAEMKIGDWGNDVLGNPAFEVAEKETIVDLVVVSVAELGFNDGATRRGIYKRAHKLGLQACPAEIGPQLRLQYPDQPRAEWLVIGMDPITATDGRLSVFNVVRCNNEYWLHGYRGHPDYLWLASDRFVFVRPQTIE
jgi:hypothetical protein